MKLKPDSEEIVTWRGTDHLHPLVKRRGSRRGLDCSTWPADRRQYLEQIAHQSDCADAVLGYPNELLAVFERASRESPSVSINASIMNGQPCIAGTRIPVHSVLRAIEHYGSLEAVVKCYPHLTIPQVKDALYFSQTILEPADGIDETETAA